VSDSGDQGLDHLRNELLRSRRRFWVRAYLSNETTPPTLRYAEFAAGRQPPGWIATTWAYEPGIFTSAIVTARAAVSAFDTATAPNVLKLGALPCQVALRDQQIHWNRRPSRAQHDRTHLPWPAVEYQLPLESSGNSQLPTGFLTSSAAPSFPSAAAAFNAFFYNDYAVTGVNAPSLGTIYLKVVDDRAAIARVVVRPSVLNVRVVGRQVKRRVLQLNGVHGPQMVPVDKAGLHAIPLPQGLPSDAWLWLLDDEQWLDYRSLGGWGNYRSDDVEIEVTVDPEAELTNLISQGEGQHLEFKRQLPDHTDDAKRTAFKTTVAFGNSGGGTQLFGVADDGQVVGLPHPVATPYFEVETARTGDKTVLVLSIRPAPGTLYALWINKNRPEYFVRRDATTFFAQPEELAAAARTGMAEATRMPF
jgi:hypothetical protein